MLWAEDIPEIEQVSANGRKATVRLIAGNLNDQESLEPNRASWAKEKEHHVGIYLIKMEPEANVTLPSVSNTLNRNLYFYEGESIEIDRETISSSNRVKLVGDQEVNIVNGAKESYLLVLEGEPINEPIAQYGPYVMNTKEEIHQAINDFQKNSIRRMAMGTPRPD